jgi:hypothetical protein
MIKFIRSEKNNTIYSRYELLNTGADEIAELRGGFDYDTGPDVSRILIEFNIDDVLLYDIKPSSVYLNFKITEKTELGDDFEIEILPIAESWSVGSGRFIDAETNYPGSSWKYKKKNELWGGGYKNETNFTGGGTWFSEIKTDTGETLPINKNVQFKNIASDLRADITDIFSLWQTDEIQNYGLILKLKNDTEIHKSSVKFFAKNTNTIYEPYLELHILDYVFNPCDIETNAKSEINSGSLNSGSINSGSLNSGSINSGSLNSGSLNSGSINSGSLNSGSINSGSINNVNDICNTKLSELNTENIIPKIKQVKKEYDKNSVIKIEVGVREKYPIKKFENRMRYTLENYTEEKMFYSLIDAETEEVVLDYSESTEISCDKGGHFFIFDFNVCNLGRMYKFLIKTKNKLNGDVYIDSRTFKVI